MFKISKISQDVYEYINNKSYRDNPNISLEDLRYLVMSYYDFDGNVKDGRMIVHKLIADEILEMFEELYDNKYEINSIDLIDDYWKNDPITTDEISMKNNNSSCFNYRIIDGKDYLSYHALGLAVDINPINNPYVINRNGNLCYDNLNSEELYYAKNRDSNINHVITHDDLAYKLFTKHGFEWGGDWDSNIYSLDYQHFEKPIISNKILYK